MALADIISRIEADAEEESSGILSSAEDRAAGIMAEAEHRAEEDRAHTLADAKGQAAREASRIVVSARLGARDATLSARRALIDEALSLAAESIGLLPDAEYEDFIARRIASVARGGESLKFGIEDVGRADAIVARLSQLDSADGLVASPEPAPFARGVLVEGDRVRVDLSLPSIVDEARDELELEVARALFGEGE